MGKSRFGGYSNGKKVTRSKAVVANNTVGAVSIINPDPTVLSTNQTVDVFGNPVSSYAEGFDYTTSQGIWDLDATVQFYKKFDYTAVTGDHMYTTPGSYYWTCPEGVHHVNVVAVGGGGGGANYTVSARSGGGGGLGWTNYIPVKPLQSYLVVVGAGGTKGAGTAGTGQNGGDTYFIATNVVCGRGGQGGGQNVGGVGGGFTGHGGGNGGNAGATTTYASGAGGAGGYTGKGGNGGNASAAGVAGLGGGAGGGAGAGSADSAGAGGGTGLFGQGGDGASSVGSTTDAGGGFGGSGGGNAAFAGSAASLTLYSSTVKPNPGSPGGGGAASDGVSGENTDGAHGGLRIIWGPDRLFPSTNTGNI